MRRTFYRISFSIAIVAGLFFLMCPQSQALIYGDDTLQLTGKLEVKAGVFTDTAEGNTYPKYSAWQLFKERNLGYLQLDHDLKTATGLDLQYHLVARAVYDGVYDFGPKVFREAYEQNKAEFERYNTKWQAGLWEAYANLKTGPVNTRVGRQNLSWGELMFMRVVDHINPMDNTWGGTGTESLDDRRIPLWMARVTYSPSQIIGFEGFLVPGAIDATTAPVGPWGSAYGSPEPDLSGSAAALGANAAGFNNAYGWAPDLERDMSHSRSGLKMMVNAGDAQVALTYQNTYWDDPGLRGRLDPNATGYTYSIEQEYSKVNIFGLSGNYVFTDADIIMRADIAHVQRAPVYFVGNFVPSAFGSGYGQFTYRDFTNFGFAVEKNIWIRAINSGERVSFVLEYYGNYCHNYDNGMIIPIPDPDNGVYPNLKRLTQIIAANISSSWHRKWDAGLAMLYNPSGTCMLIPSVTYRFDNPLALTLDYTVVVGNAWEGIFSGATDRDKLTLLLKYEF